MLLPSTRQTPSLDILDAALVEVESRAHPRLIFTMAPQEGKSERVSRWFVLWYLVRNPDARIAVVSYAHELAARWGQAVRDEIEAHPELGLMVRPDIRATHKWQLAGHDGGMVTAGIGSGLTGRRVDLLIIDDPLSGQADAESKTIRENCILWWQGTGSTRRSPGAPVVIIQTRWHEEDLSGHFLATQKSKWRYINIPAQAETEDDVLGRQVGEFMVSAQGRSREDWLDRKEDAGSRGWNALFQGHPSAPEGNVFKRDWWVIAPFRRALKRSDGRMEAIGCDQVIISVDCAFKDTDGSDFVVMQVWGRRGAQAYLLDQVRGRMDFPGTCAALVGLSARWPQATLKVVEDKANGPAVIQQLRGKVGGLVPYSPVDSKLARANAVAPFAESRNVEIPDPKDAPWVGDWIEEMAAFPNGTHDDQVDCATQALIRLFIAGGSLQSFMAQVRAGN